MKITKQIIAATLTMTLIVIYMSTSSVYADSGSYSSYTYANNRDVFTSTNVKWSNNGSSDRFVGVINEVITGNASNIWYGSKPYNADMISLTNSVCCERWGGTFSVSCGGSNGASMSISSSGNRTDYTYSVTDNWKLNSDFTYTARVSGLWIVADLYFETTAITQIGASFYQTTTGYNKISL